VTVKKKANRMQQALLETTRDFHRGGLTSEAELEKITMRVLGRGSLPATPRLTAEEIKQLRARSRLSQAVLASYLGVTVGYLSRMERGEASPSRPVARLLDIMRRKGLEAIF
jgi:putative transcriptional regulator